MGSFSRTSLAGVAVIVVTGCGPDAPARVPATVRDSAGVEIVENHDPAWPEGGGWSLSEAPLLEIGELSSPNPALEFHRIFGLARTSDGGIVVLDGLTNQLRFFDAEGNPVKTLGGRGDQPGQLRMATRLYHLPADTLALWDAGLGRIFLLGPDGTVGRQVVVDSEKLAGLAEWVPCPSAPLPDLSYLLCLPASDEPLPSEPGPDGTRAFARLARVSPDMDSIIPLGLYGGLEQWGLDLGNMTRTFNHPWAPRTAIDAGGDPMRIAVALNPAYSVELWSPDGRLERIVRRTGLPEPTAEDREAAREQFLLAAGRDTAVAERLRSETRTPVGPPAIHALLLDSSGNLWVLRRPSLVRRLDFVLDVFDPEGQFLGEIALPSGFAPREIGPDYMLGVHVDRYEIERVRLYGLERSAG